MFPWSLRVPRVWHVEIFFLMSQFNSKQKGVLKKQKEKAREVKKRAGAAVKHKTQVSLTSGKRTGSLLARS